MTALPYQPTRATLRAAILDMDARAGLAIGRAYWLFTRTARAKPPCLVVPEAYQTEIRCRALLKQLGRITPEEQAEATARIDATRCLKCQALPDERCGNAEREGGVCSRDVSFPRMLSQDELGAAMGVVRP